MFADELGVEYGDVVMFDGAPVGRQGGVPIFPHLATLHRRSYQIWRFVGAQATKGQLIALSKHLPEDTVIYPHTEQIVVLCDACAKGRGGDGHAHTPEQAHHVVRGKLCAPPHLAPATVLAALDAAIAGAPGAQMPRFHHAGWSVSPRSMARWLAAWPSAHRPRVLKNSPAL